MIKTGKIHKKNLKLLYRSFDADLKEKGRRRLEEALGKSESLRREKKLITERRQAVADSTAKSFRPQFAERVMARIAGMDAEQGLQESFYEALKASFRRFALVGALALLALIFFNLIKGDVLPLDEVFFASDIALEEILNLPLF